ncbi:MAG TPA: sigma-70 family RNA polymerase sigma factor [Planctomycetes bacterium]|nr:sigma-70 family RNA polymerase sigma factor [Fuerstiella sp.]HIK91840.1 sigma-70 family RNA polymerase sigma factor [Planctomycetota bacterium]
MSDESEIATRLIAQLKGGEDGALAELFLHYRDRLKRIVRFRLDYRLAGRISESDVIQESYISASKRADHYRGKPDMPFFVWLRLIVNQQLADLHRQHLQAEMRDVRKEISLERPGASPHTSLAMAAQLAGDVTSASRAYSRVERISNLEEALNQMEPIDREVIALRHFEELTNGEVSDVLGIGIQAASKRYVRAMKRMKEIVSAIPGLAEN